ncbi:MAG: hypothetical protein V2A70_03110 [Candidatus Omnitrophota bacterium]
MKNAAIITIIFLILGTPLPVMAETGLEQIQNLINTTIQQKQMAAALDDHEFSRQTRLSQLQKSKFALLSYGRYGGSFTGLDGAGSYGGAFYGPEK